MRMRVGKAQKHKARGVSLPPDIEKAALAKAFKLDVSFSKYVQRLIRVDLEQSILRA